MKKVIFLLLVLGVFIGTIGGMAENNHKYDALIGYLEAGDIASADQEYKRLIEEIGAAAKDKLDIQKIQLGEPMIFGDITLTTADRQPSADFYNTAYPFNDFWLTDAESEDTLFIIQLEAENYPVEDENYGVNHFFCELQCDGAAIDNIYVKNYESDVFIASGVYFPKNLVTESEKLSLRIGYRNEYVYGAPYDLTSYSDVVYEIDLSPAPLA